MVTLVMLGAEPSTTTEALSLLLSPWVSVAVAVQVMLSPVVAMAVLRVRLVPLPRLVPPLLQA